MDKLSSPSSPLTTTKAFKKIGLVCRPKSRLAWKKTSQANQYLISQGCETMILGQFKYRKERPQYQSATVEEIGKQCDLVVSLGGDGTFLYTGRTFAPFDIPIVGINLGRVGFLLNIKEEDIEVALDALLKGNYTTQSQLLIHHNQTPDERSKVAKRAMNDIVIKPPDMRMMEAEVKVDGQVVIKTRSDGLIFSTPIGSTSYSKSAGGPVLNRKLDAFIITPISPHFNNANSHVCTSSQSITVHLNAQKSDFLRLYCDGMFCTTIYTPTTIRIRKHRHRLKIIEPVF